MFREHIAGAAQAVGGVVTGVEPGASHEEKTMKRQWGIVAAVVLAGLLAGEVGAQEVRSVSSKAPVVNTRADRLKEAAEALYEQPHRLHRAAELHEQEASQRAVSDPQQVEALDRAARLYAYSGDAERAHVLMARAARLALRRGDVARAAHAYVDAAFMALRMRDVRLAQEMTREADLLALSPLLPEVERVAIVRRIDPARAQLGTAGH
ncbi:MAG: hypothetical protein ACRENP_08765 [Longimicrobiales bacterium]